MNGRSFDKPVLSPPKGSDKRNFQQLNDPAAAPRAFHFRRRLWYHGFGAGGERIPRRPAAGAKRSHW